MKRFRILSTILFGAIMFSTLQSTLSSFLEGFNVGYKIGIYEFENNYDAATYVSLHTALKKDASLIPEKKNTISGDSITVIPRLATIINFTSKDKAASKTSTEIISIGLMAILKTAILALGIVIFILYMKINIAFVRNDVFKHKIIRQISVIGYCYLALGVIGSVILLSETFMARQAIALEQLDISYSQCISWDELVIGLVILVMNEIVKVATTLKEEQELTI